MADFNSPYYPYEKVQQGHASFRGIDLIPGKLVRYLLDLPDAAGYVPADDNSRPRVRLAKYLWYDGRDPLSQPLPTPDQKLSLLYNGDNAMLSTAADRAAHPKGYRVYGQTYWEAERTEANVVLKCYMGRTIPKDDYRAALGINFVIDINYAFDNVMRTEQYSKLYAMYQAVLESLHGVAVAGVGTVQYNRTLHGDCGFSQYHQEGGSVYASFTMAVDWMDTAD